jgi:hypothetical protein
VSWAKFNVKGSGLALVQWHVNGDKFEKIMTRD